MTLHTCFPRRARLNCSKSLNPNPPWIFGKHNFFHPTQWILWASPLYPYQNFLIKDSISLQRYFGSLKQFIVKVGMNWITVIKISLLAWDNSSLSNLGFFFPKFFPECRWSSVFMLVQQRMEVPSIFHNVLQLKPLANLWCVLALVLMC